MVRLFGAEGGWQEYQLDVVGLLILLFLAGIAAGVVVGGVFLARKVLHRDTPKG